MIIKDRIQFAQKKKKKKFLSSSYTNSTRHNLLLVLPIQKLKKLYSKVRTGQRSRINFILCSSKTMNFACLIQTDNFIKIRWKICLQYPYSFDSFSSKIKFLEWNFSYRDYWLGGKMRGILDRNKVKRYKINK